MTSTTPDPEARRTSQFSPYLESLDLSPLAWDRVERVIEFYTKVAQIEPVFLFVSEHLEQNQRRVFDSVWIVGENAICEAKNFIAEDDFDCIPLRSRIEYWEVLCENFSWTLNTTDAKSRFTVHINFGGRMSATLRATSENCVRLTELLKTYIIPNLYEKCPREGGRSG